MQVSAIPSVNFKSNTETGKDSPKTKFTDNFQTKLRNSADMSDCISVPRTIFKGYLGIMIGTSLGSIASLLKPSKTKKAVAAAGIVTALYGTWAFVRPYILKDAVPSVNLNQQTNNAEKR